MRKYYAEARRTLKIAIPLILANLLQTSMATIDTVMAGMKNDQGLTQASVSIGSSVWLACSLIMVGICMPLSPIFGRAFAASDAVGIRKFFWNAFWLAIYLGIIIFVVTFLSPYLLVWINIDDKILLETTAYIHIMAFSIPFSALFLAPRFLNEGTGNSGVLLYIALLSIPFNITGNYILLNGLLGLPKMGASGIAISSLTSLIVSTLLMYCYMFSSKKMQAFKLFSEYSPLSLPVIKSLLKIGVPVSATLMLEVSMFTAVVLLAGKMGVVSAAANQIALNYISLIFMVPLGVSMALAARVGQATAKNDLAHIRVIGLSGFFLGMIVMLFSIVAILLYANDIAGLYNDDATIVSLAANLLFYAAMFQLCDALQVCAAGCLRGMHDTKIPMCYAILGYWIVGMPLAYYLSIVLQKGPSGLWIGLLFGLSITAVLNSSRFWLITKKVRNY